jgi:Tol biopolymer transport system component
MSRGLEPRGEPVRLTTGLNAHTISLDRAGSTIAYSVFTTVANIWSTPFPTDPVVSPPLRQITTGNQTIESATVSPDGKWLAFDSNLNGNQDIFKMPVSGGEAQQLTRNHGDNFNPSWSPDGTEITFHSLVNGNRDAFIMTSSGANVRPVIATASQEMIPYWAAPNVVYFLVRPDSIFEIRRIGKPPREWGKPRLVLRGSPIVRTPDGQRLAYMAFDGARGPRLEVTSTDGSNKRIIPAAEVLKWGYEFGTLFWSGDSQRLYIPLRENSGISTIWQFPLDGTPLRRVLTLNDPRRQFYNPIVASDGRNLYLTIGDRQSDVWTMELNKN